MRRPARVLSLPPLARPLLGAKRARGVARVRQKLARAGFNLAHGTLRLPATAILDVAGRRVAVDARTTTFTIYASALARGGYEPELGAFLDLAAPGRRVVYDIGANWGHFAIHFATCTGFAGAVHAFEAAPDTAALLRRVIEAAGLGDRVTVHGFGLSASDGALPMVGGGHTSLARLVPGARGRAVAVKRLDGLELPPPDIVKIDVEGHEGEVLAGAAETIGRALPLIVLESWYGAGSLGPLRFLAERGYTLYRFAWEDADGLTLDAPREAGTLALLPLLPEDRLALPWDFNVAAIPSGLSIPGLV